MTDWDGAEWAAISRFAYSVGFTWRPLQNSSGMKSYKRQQAVVYLSDH